MGSSISTGLDVIDMRSFSSLWYWIGLAVVWSVSTQWVLGVPYEMVFRARRDGGRSMADLEAMVRIQVGRRLRSGRATGMWTVAVMSFVLAGLFTWGFIYGFELAQASFLLVFPLSVVWLLALNTAALIEARTLRGEDLCRQLTRHRMAVQVLGALFIFATAMWGMYRNFAVGIL